MQIQYLYLLAGTGVGFLVGALAALLAAGVRKARLDRDLALSLQECARLNDELRARREGDAERQAAFERLSDDILRKREEALEAENRQNIGQLLAPIREDFEKFQRLVRETREGSREDGAALRELVAREMRHMQELAAQVGGDARGLKAALVGNVNARGQWGEALLEGILRDSGLVKDIHYATQVSLADDDGHGRPDVVVRQPDGSVVVIDSKALFPNYYEYVEAETPEARKKALAEHLQSVRGTIANLSRRHYEKRVAGSIDFVVMFFPLEGAYQLVLSSEPKILTEALERNVLPVGPATLIVMLTIIGRMWRSREQDENAEKILRVAKELADRVVAFGADLDAVGKGLESARAAYGSAVRRLSSPDGRTRSVAAALSALKALQVRSGRDRPAVLSDGVKDPDGLTGEG